jgi:TRAP-type mannitol/chloroaromatic compound transport system permease small subunit
MYEVIMRYIFNRPTVWAHEIAGMLYAIYFLLGGAYALRWDGHIQIEFLYIRLSARKRAIIDCCTWMFFYFFCGVILLKGLPFAWDSIVDMERSSSPFAPPIWPIKIFIPIAALLFLLQGSVKSIRMGIIAVTGQDPYSTPADNG